MDGVKFDEMLSTQLKTLKEDERGRVIELLENLPEAEVTAIIDTGNKFHKSSAVNSTWFWRTVPVLAEMLPPAELAVWLEEGAGISRGAWECSLSFLKTGPEILACTDVSTFLQWAAISRALVRYSNHDANWFLKNSTSIFGKLDRNGQDRLVSGMLRLLELSWKSALACLKAWPGIVRWKNEGYEKRILEAGLKMAETVPHETSAFFEAIPGFLENAGITYMDAWLEAAMILRTDRRGLIGSFFRHTPGLPGKTETGDFADKLYQWANFGAELAVRDDKIANAFFEHTPEVLKNLDWAELNKWVLLIRQVSDEYSVQGALEFVRTTPGLLSQLYIKELAGWTRYGLDVIKGDKRLAFFALKSQESRDAVSRFRTGLHLEAAKKVLHLYSEALTGEAVIIRNALDLPEGIHGSQKLWGSLDTRRIYLPDIVKEYENESDNLRLYRVMMMHLTAHRQFGTLSLTHGELRELAGNPLLGVLFELIEDNRVEYLAVQTYPGFSRDIGLLLSASPADIDIKVSEDSIPGPVNEGTAVFGYLRNFLWGERSELAELLPDRFKEEYLIFWEKVVQNGASARESLKTARTLCELVDTGGGNESSLPKAGNLKFRGCLKYELIYMAVRVDEEETGSSDAELPVQPAGRSGQEVSFNSDFYIHLRKLLGQFIEDEENPYRFVAYYDEWDRSLNDYKKDWCRVREVLLKPSSGRIVTRTLEEHGGLINTLKRYFGMLRPDRLRRYGRQEDGEDIDIDAVIEAMAEKQAGVLPGEGLYIRRDKRERNVAVGFLLDLSYSTEEAVAGTGKTLLDIETESVIVMAEALEVLGDNYAIYGFNSDSRDKINFYVVKDFDEKYTTEVQQRFGGLQSYGMTRLAAAVRHAVFKLEKVPAAIKILILLSDGRPFDFDYNSGLTKDHEEFYAETDTRAALREAKMKGINPFCITVDNRGRDYLEYIYGNVSYIIIDDVNALPAKLTETYKNLTT